MILQSIKIKAIFLYINLRKVQGEVTSPMSLVIKLVLPITRAGFFKVSPRVKILWRVYFSEKHHRKDI